VQTTRRLNPSFTLMELLHVTGSAYGIYRLT
jgi:hypothetical protein